MTPEQFIEKALLLQERLTTPHGVLVAVGKEGVSRYVRPEEYEDFVRLLVVRLSVEDLGKCLDVLTELAKSMEKETE